MDYLSETLPKARPMKPVEAYEEFVPATKETFVETAETWLSSEMTLVSDKEYADPLTECELDLVLTCGKTVLKVPGFWDGGKLWRVRFALTKVGKWSWKTVCTDKKNKGLHGKTGTVECVPYSGELDVYRHGFVKTIPGKKYFVYDDGTPFFYLGDTHWNYLSEEYDEAGERAAGVKTTSHFKYIVNKRASQGYTVYQTEPLEADWEITENIDEKDVLGFQRMDKYVRYIAAQGLTHANAQFFFPSSMPKMLRSPRYPENLLQAARYWIARYASFPVMWTLAQEIDQEAYFLFIMTHEDGVEDLYDEYPYITLAKKLNELDPYKHPLSAHMQGTYSQFQGTGACNSSFRKVKEHTWWASQWKPKYENALDFTVPVDFWLHGQGKPAIVYEGCYDHLWTDGDGARIEGWLAYMNGMFGYGYGCIDMWLYKSQYDIKYETYRNGVCIPVRDKLMPWGKAIEFPAGYQAGYMREFFEQFPWWEFRPRFNDPKFFRSDRSFYCGGTVGDTTLIYFWGLTTTRTGTVQSLEPGAKYTLSWYNPRTNRTGKPVKLTAGEDGTLVLPPRPALNDWVAIVEKA